jgi:hypothetical protein
MEKNRTRQFTVETCGFITLWIRSQENVESHQISLCIVVCPFVLFQLVIVLSVLPFTGSDSPFGIFKFFQQLTSKYINDFNISHLWIYLEVKYITYYLTLLLILRYEDILRNEIWWLSTFSWDLIHKVINPPRVHEENRWPVASHWQTLSHNVVSSTPRHERG